MYSLVFNAVIGRINQSAICKCLANDNTQCNAKYFNAIKINIHKLWWTI